MRRPPAPDRIVGTPLSPEQQQSAHVYRPAPAPGRIVGTLLWPGQQQGAHVYRAQAVVSQSYQPGRPAELTADSCISRAAGLIRAMSAAYRSVSKST